MLSMRIPQRVRPASVASSTSFVYAVIAAAMCVAMTPGAWAKEAKEAKEERVDESLGFPIKLVAASVRSDARPESSEGSEASDGSDWSTGESSAGGAEASNGAVDDVAKKVDDGAKKIDVSKLPESEIPVLTEDKGGKKSAGVDLHRISITLAVLAVALGAVCFGLKRWADKSKAGRNRNTRIKVLTQHHLGPKKSLVIIQVAGESLLIGVTDHNISMLRTLSLLDEEIPEQTPADFKSAMAAGFDGGKFNGEKADPEEDFTMRGLSEIRDVVTSRLKNMRSLE